MSVDLTCYLVIGAKLREVGENAYTSGKPTVRVAKSKPRLAANEVAIALNLSLPTSLFQRPDLTAKITIPGESAPFVITPDVQQNIADQIREQTGFTVQIEVAAPEES
jgi:hypothetical protein